MIIQIPDTMPPEHYRPINIHGIINLYAYIAYAALLFSFGIYFFLQAKKQDLESVKRIKISLGMFGVCYGTTRVLFILMFNINPDVFYNMFAALAYSMGMIGFTDMIWALEKVKYKKNYFFIVASLTTLIVIIAAITIISLTLSGVVATELRIITLYIIYIGSGIAMIMIIFLYISLIRLSTGIVRKKAFYSFLGLVIMTIGILLDSQFFLAVESIPIWIKMDLLPIITIIGYLIFAITQI
ncbi:MAG: hypothetical protein ACTSR8_00300 [Promethearchaeota archaeon]